MTYTLNFIAEWLEEEGFNEAANHLLRKSLDIYYIAELDWLDYQDELKKAHLAYRDKLKKAHALLDPSRDEDNPLPF